ncbi:MAG: ribosomal subunit interface protein [SAR116 cluster bacterium]|nr:ribosomal subunit interface protein [SAR116 cluster bacterium]RPH00464.1 MAG: ribosome-associated translation inhibitor RaiA [Candidatus Puniceispirillum sp. TMED176]|tara:strand:- start:2824 stop:3417 length:594 start_codon:yes stop_codon:yes gene_type:complete
MNISVSGKNMDTGSAFQTHAETALNNVVEKYFDRAVSGHVTLEKADSGFRVKTRVALSRRMELEATGFAHDAHAALEAAIEHAEKRLRRHKRRLKNHRGALTQSEEDDVLPATMMVYAGADQIDDDAENDDIPAVVAELAYDIEMLTVEQAVMKLELSEAPMLMFRNAAHFGLNVVHRRDDGSIGWIDPRGVRHLNS